MTINKKPILVIDDEPEACEMIKSFLEDRNYTVITAPNGREGINAIKEKNPALVFLDVRMPDITGIDVLAELKKENISVKVILMTGVETGDEIEKAKELGIVNLLKKPVQLMTLSEIVKQHATS